MTAPRIVLLHATTVAMGPIHRAMHDMWPEAESVNLLDDALSIDRAQEGETLSDPLIARFEALGRYAAGPMRAAGILATCSAFGSALNVLAANLAIPVVKPNEPMFEAAIAAGPRIAMLATFAPAVASMEVEFKALAPDGDLTSIVVPGAIEALRRGDAATHNRLIAETATHLRGYDAVMLAHFSTSRALADVQVVTDLPVFSAPESAVNRIRSLVEQRCV
ncbi:MAG: hypothetical protein KA748_06685 [Halomonas sp.]|nr:hypothetical protein [Halomonas sp.]MBP5979874.1 hypothetical protein [Halomonas sp.]